MSKLNIDEPIIKLGPESLIILSLLLNNSKKVNKSSWKAIPKMIINENTNTVTLFSLKPL